MTRFTKGDILIQMHKLSHETGLGLELENATIRGEGRTRFNLWKIDEDEKRVFEVIEVDLTAREMYQALKAARSVYEAATNMDS